MKLEPLHRQPEQIIDRGSCLVALHLWDRLIGTAIGKHHDVDHRAVETGVAQADLTAEQSNDLDLDLQMICVGVRDLTGRFQSVDGEVVSFELQLRKIPLEAFELNFSAGDLFKLGDHLEPHAVREAVAGKKQSRGDDQRKKQK